jgi:putative hydrolase of the HAD superfamily
MSNGNAITCLFLDIGGVLLTDGWSHDAGKMAAKKFRMNLEELNKRHTEAIDIYEVGKLTLKEFLNWVVFYEKRSFTQNQFRKFIYEQSKSYPQMIALIRRLKLQYGLKIVVVSNEGREFNEFRIHKFKLDEFVDYFISSCYVGLRKPDADIFRVALDIVRVHPNQVIYIDNTPMFVQIAECLGIQSILQTDYKTTFAKLASFGLKVVE